MSDSRAWVPDEEEWLIDLALDGKSNAVIGQILNRSEKSINRKRTRLVEAGRLIHSRRGPKPENKHTTVSGLMFVRMLRSPWCWIADGVLARTVRAA